MKNDKLLLHNDSLANITFLLAAQSLGSVGLIFDAIINIQIITFIYLIKYEQS